MIPQWKKAELEDWCRGFCRTPHTTLKAFIDAGFCSDQEPSREELRLWPKLPAKGGAGQSLTHVYRAHKEYPWFCEECGYAEHERLKHHPDTTTDSTTKPVISRPAEPEGNKRLWYRGWETAYDRTAEQWTREGYYACLGGEDLDCISVSARTWDELLDEIDDHPKTGDKA